VPLGAKSGALNAVRLPAAPPGLYPPFRRMVLPSSNPAPPPTLGEDGNDAAHPLQCLQQISLQPENWAPIMCVAPQGTDDVFYGEGFDRFSVYVERLISSGEAAPSPIEIQLRAGTYQSTEILYTGRFTPSLGTLVWDSAGLVAQIGNLAFTSLEIWGRIRLLPLAAAVPAPFGVVFTVTLERAGQGGGSAITLFTGELMAG
jgi:hypothetical protein